MLLQDWKSVENIRLLYDSNEKQIFVTKTVANHELTPLFRYNGSISLTGYQVQLIMLRLR